MATAGMILGMVGVALLVLGIIAFILLVVIGIASDSTSY